MNLLKYYRSMALQQRQGMAWHVIVVYGTFSDSGLDANDRIAIDVGGADRAQGQGLPQSTADRAGRAAVEAGPPGTQPEGRSRVGLAAGRNSAQVVVVSPPLGRRMPEGPEVRWEVV